MSSDSVVGAIGHRAELRAIAILEEHKPGTSEELKQLGPTNPVRQPWHTSARVATMMAALAEVVEDQARKIAELEQKAQTKKK